MIEVSSPAHFSPDHYIDAFTGKDYEDSIQKAKLFALESGVKLSAYFKQKAFGRSILVSYTRSAENENK